MKPNQGAARANHRPTGQPNGPGESGRDYCKRRAFPAADGSR